MKTLDTADRSAFQQPGDALPRPHDNCYWLLPGRIIAGEYPSGIDERSSRPKLRAILSLGVTRFIDLTEVDELVPYAELMHAEAAAQGRMAKHERHPIRDLGVPSVARMRTILDTLESDRDGVTYVHCWGGVGRTGTVAGCLLVHAGFTSEEAIAILAGKWMVMAKRHRHPRSPETMEQLEFIRAWAMRSAIVP
jgi:protein-tyrosine phosphatase